MRRTSLLDGARTATGIAVVIDVFRAFTTAAFCVAAGSREIVLVAEPEQGLAMKAHDASVFLVGEVGGRAPAGFDAGNSPSLIERLDLSGRRVVQRTSAGTVGVAAAAASAREIVLASFVIAEATARYVMSRGGEVTLIAMGEKGIDADAGGRAVRGVSRRVDRRVAACGARLDRADLAGGAGLAGVVPPA